MAFRAIERQNEDTKYSLVILGNLQLNDMILVTHNFYQAPIALSDIQLFFHCEEPDDIRTV